MIERFNKYVDRRGEAECWPWLGCSLKHGRGRFWHDGRMRMATQVAWSIANEKPFPAGALACHSCDNPSCVNPAHIWPGTYSENMTDASNKGRLGGQRLTHCKNGHEFNAENSAPIGTNGRQCLVCNAAYKMASKRRLRAARAALAARSGEG